MLLFLSISLLSALIFSLISSQQREGYRGEKWYSLSLIHRKSTIPFNVILAKDEVSRRKGLSILSSLREGRGMLFLFPREGVHSFWMKDMQFPIDILWFNTQRELCSIKERAKPEDYPAVYTPNCVVRYVLEIPAGDVEKYHLERGDKIDLSHIPDEVLVAE